MEEFVFKCIIMCFIYDEDEILYFIDVFSNKFCFFFYFIVVVFKYLGLCYWCCLII